MVSTLGCPDPALDSSGVKKGCQESRTQSQGRPGHSWPLKSKPGLGDLPAYCHRQGPQACPELQRPRSLPTCGQGHTQTRGGAGALATPLVSSLQMRWEWAALEFRKLWARPPGEEAVVPKLFGGGWHVWAGSRRRCRLPLPTSRSPPPGRVAAPAGSAGESCSVLRKSPCALALCGPAGPGVSYRPPVTGASPATSP